jgi:diacylglycerol kinase family enzyme
MKILLIYNPFAGFGKSKSVLPEVKQAFSDKGVTCDLLLTNSKGHATKLVKNANLSKYDAVVSSGGDGTFHEVLNGYYQNEEPNKPPIGIIPNGTGNV